MSEYSIAGTNRVRGARQTLRELRQLDRKLYWATIRKMKEAAQPLADTIDGNFPETPPMRGFDHAGVTGWNTPKKTVIKVGGKRGRNSWPLVRIIVMDPARQLFDMAADNRLGRELDQHGFGTASRAVWRVSGRLRAQATDDVIDAIRVESAKINLDLKREW